MKKNLLLPFLIIVTLIACQKDEIKLKNIISVTSLADITVPYGTEFSTLTFPTTATITYSDNSSEDVSVTFSQGSYVATVPGTYALNGTLTLTSGTTNTMNVMASINVIVSMQTGFQGETTEKLPNGDFGASLVGVKIIFTKDDGTLTSTILSGADGRYKIILPPGKYVVVATEAEHEIYNSAPGFFVVTGVDGIETGNFFLKKLTYGLQGASYIRNPDKSIGSTLPNVKLTFTKTDGLFTKSVVTGANGYYKITLPIGNYYEKSEKDAYTDENANAPGWDVITGTDGFETGNFFFTLN